MPDHQQARGVICQESEYSRSRMGVGRRTGAALRRRILNWGLDSAERWSPPPMAAVGLRKTGPRLIEIVYALMGIMNIGVTCMYVCYFLWSRGNEHRHGHEPVLPLRVDHVVLDLLHLVAEVPHRAVRHGDREGEDDERDRLLLFG